MRYKGLFALLFVLFLGADEVRAQEPDGSGGEYWSPYYLVDYGLGAGGLLLELFYRGEPRQNALIGPSFDPGDPAAILDPRYSASLGSPFVPEHEWTVPNNWLQMAAYGQVLFVSGHEVLARLGTGQDISAQRLHHSMLVAFQATAVNAGLSRVVKSFTGRLRPDFQDRVLHVYCSLPDQQGLDCSNVDPARLIEDPEEALEELKEGRYSFMSGHASNAMLVATNLALQTGGLWVWGENATPASRLAGAGAIAVFYGLGAFSGISRTSLMDNVHHTSDVIAGSIAGIAIANLFYWLHFDTSGNPRSSHWLEGGRGETSRLGVTDLRAGFGGASIAISGSF